MTINLEAPSFEDQMPPDPDQINGLFSDIQDPTAQPEQVESLPTWRDRVAERIGYLRDAIDFSARFRASEVQEDDQDVEEKVDQGVQTAVEIGSKVISGGADANEQLWDFVEDIQPSIDGATSAAERRESARGYLADRVEGAKARMAERKLYREEIKQDKEDRKREKEAYEQEGKDLSILLADRYLDNVEAAKTRKFEDRVHKAQRKADRRESRQEIYETSRKVVRSIGNTALYGLRFTRAFAEEVVSYEGQRAQEAAKNQARKAQEAAKAKIFEAKIKHDLKKEEEKFNKNSANVEENSEKVDEL